MSLTRRWSGLSAVRGKLARCVLRGLGGGDPVWLPGGSVSIMKRAASEKPRTLRIWRRHLASHDHKIACRCELQPGRFRKGQRIGGCSRARCRLCHYDKLSKLATLQECRAAATLYEGLSEMECLNSPSPQVRVTARGYNKAVGCIGSNISDRKQTSAAF